MSNLIVLFDYFSMITSTFAKIDCQMTHLNNNAHHPDGTRGKATLEASNSDEIEELITPTGTETTPSISTKNWC
jgi:hypothetical protein